MQKTVLVLSWLAGAAVVGMLIFLGLFIWSNTTPGAQTYSPWIHFFDGIAPYLGFVTLACEALALVLFVGLRSWRWLLSALGAGFVAILIPATICLAVGVIGGPNV
jgi:hypothetical protein